MVTRSHPLLAYAVLCMAVITGGWSSVSALDRNVSGRLLDSVTKRPIAGAAVTGEIDNDGLGVFPQLGIAVEF